MLSKTPQTEIAAADLREMLALAIPARLTRAEERSGALRDRRVAAVGKWQDAIRGYRDGVGADRRAAAIGQAQLEIDKIDGDLAKASRELEEARATAAPAIEATIQPLRAEAACALRLACEQLDRAAEILTAIDRVAARRAIPLQQHGRVVSEQIAALRTVADRLDPAGAEKEISK